MVERNWIQVAVLLIAWLVSAPLSAAERVGTTVYVRGANIASNVGDIRLMGAGTPIYRDDVLTTGTDSFVIVEFNDGARMTLRPNTVFRIDEYADRKGDERMRLNLFEGGMRTVTGGIAKHRPENFSLRTPLATVGVLGTDFSTRLCKLDCAEEAENLGDAADGADIIGRVAFVKGEVGAVSRFKKQRILLAGAAVFQGDTLEIGGGAFAIVVFRDESRITLLENTRFQIDRHQYDADTSVNSSALMRLIRGGIRVVGGLISKARPEAYKIDTPVSTISTRGTKFDIVCAGTCIDQGHTNLNGLFVHVRDGRVTSESSAGTFEFAAGVTAFIETTQTMPRTDVPLSSTMSVLLAQTPAPEGVQVAAGLLRDTSRAVGEGDLTVAVYDGRTTVVPTTGAPLELGEGEAGLFGSAGTARLESGIPAFVVQDPYNFSPVVEVDQGGRIQDGLPKLDEEDSLSCRL